MAVSDERPLVKPPHNLIIENRKDISITGVSEIDSFDENTVIAMTSNAGSNIQSGQTGFGKTLGEMSKEKVLKALSDFLRPEFLSRVDEVVVFSALTKQNLMKIAALMLDEMREPLLEKMIVLKYDDLALEKLADMSEGGKYGARDLRRNIRKNVEDKIATLLVESKETPTSVLITADEKDIIVNVE